MNNIKKNIKNKRSTYILYNKKGIVLLAVLVCCGLGACRTDQKALPDEPDVPLFTETPDAADEHSDSDETQRDGTAETGQIESAQDGTIDFELLWSLNPDIFAWLYVPGTDIDLPLLQSGIADDYYATHTPDGAAGAAGAAYTEMANLMNMCDFNTIIHGKDDKEGDIFYQLHQFENPEFFDSHDSFIIYLPDNRLTYTVFTAYYDEDSDILRRYDYTTYAGCIDYLEDMYGARDVGRNIRDGWEDLTPYHFLVTLNGTVDNEVGTQYVVIGSLSTDEAGTIDRMILD